MHDLRRRGREPASHQDDQDLDREAVRQQDRLVQPYDKPASKLSARRWSALSPAFRVLIAFARRSRFRAPHFNNLRMGVSDY
jgi:hypothetical protein